MVSMTFRPKQELYKTAMYKGEYVAIIRAFYNGDKFGTWRYSIRHLDGRVEAQVDEKHFSRFIL